MPTFGDLDAYYDPGLTLTVKGKEYTLPLPSAELGLWARRIAQSAGEVDGASDERELIQATEKAASRIAALPVLPGDLTFEQRILGHVYDQMIQDKVPDPYVQFCAQTGYVWIIGGENAAALYWETGGRPEAIGPNNRASRRAAARKTSTATANVTPSPGSSSGTSSRPKSKRRGRGKRAPGQTS
ncbi:hypothetical protein [Actinoplanes sp. NPDC049599]|uniref:DUF7426 family protein n=1 Tax=Actinoplanes sp. NPDC049599 TaxID=3363903 RepID=UPI00379A41FB